MKNIFSRKWSQPAFIVSYLREGVDFVVLMTLETLQEEERVPSSKNFNSFKIYSILNVAKNTLHTTLP